MMPDKKGPAGRGFSGLEGMVSDVSAEARQPKPTATPQSNPGPKPAPQGAPQVPPAASRRAVSSTPAEKREPENVVFAPPSKGASAKGWFIGIGIVVVLLWFWGSSGTDDASPPKYTPSATYQSAPAAPTYQPEPRSAPVYSESRPPVGAGHVLDLSQIRYCLAESIRIESMRNFLDDTSEEAVDAFNEFVGDFNARCASYRYRTGTLESARFDVEARRSQLVAQGYARAMQYR